MNNSSLKNSLALKSVWVVIPAAGFGRRTQSNIPKQYLQIQNHSVLAHTVSQFLDHPEISGVMVVIAKNDPYWDEFFKSFKGNIDSQPAKLKFCVGGEQRINSVMAGIDAVREYVANDDWLLVHDAARPGIKTSDLDQLFQFLRNKEPQVDGFLLAQKMADTLKKTNMKAVVNSTIDRTNIWQAQTPQAFKYLELKDCLKNQLAAAQTPTLITDESSAMELAGYKVQAIQSSRGNFKITSKEDLVEMDWELDKQFKLTQRLTPEKFFHSTRVSEKI